MIRLLFSILDNLHKVVSTLKFDKLFQQFILKTNTEDFDEFIYAYECSVCLVTYSIEIRYFHRCVNAAESVSRFRIYTEMVFTVLVLETVILTVDGVLGPISTRGIQYVFVLTRRFPVGICSLHQRFGQGTLRVLRAPSTLHIRTSGFALRFTPKTTKSGMLPGMTPKGRGMSVTYGKYL